MTGDEYAARAFYDRWKQTNVPWEALGGRDKTLWTQRFFDAAKSRLTTPRKYHESNDIEGAKPWGELTDDELWECTSWWLRHLDDLAWLGSSGTHRSAPERHFEPPMDGDEVAQALGIAPSVMEQHTDSAVAEQIEDPGYYSHREIDCPNCGHRLQMADIAKAFGYILGQAFKYLYREDRKEDPVKQLKKCGWFINYKIAEYRAAAKREQDVRALADAMYSQCTRPVYSIWLQNPEQCGDVTGHEGECKP